jgi:predicted secreted hydrolase
MACGLCPAVSQERDFAKAVPGRTLTFPQDHGKHPDFQTEWWYFTGNLVSSEGRRWGFQLTFFRRTMFVDTRQRQSRWAVRDVYPAHFAISDLTNNEYFHTEIISREGPDLAVAAPDKLHVRVKGWSAEGQDEKIQLKVLEAGYGINVTLVPVKPPVLHGQGGYSRKAAGEGQASHYYSFTRMAATGSILFRGTAYKVEGLAWMDHEFGSGLLQSDQVGWDWFSLQLDDGTELMIFYLRKKDGTREPVFGTFVEKDGQSQDLQGREIVVTSTGTWPSPHTRATYPSGWRIRIPHLDLSLNVDPALKDQEFSGEQTTDVAYWEGAVTIRGTRAGKAIGGRGYTELTGYAKPMSGQL